MEWTLLQDVIELRINCPQGHFTMSKCASRRKQQRQKRSWQRPRKQVTLSGGQDHRVSDKGWGWRSRRVEQRQKLRSPIVDLRDGGAPPAQAWKRNAGSISSEHQPLNETRSPSTTWPTSERHHRHRHRHLFVHKNAASNPAANSKANSTISESYGSSK